MKLVFVAVSLIVVLTVDCRSSRPEPDPQHLGIAEDDEWPEPDSLHLDVAEDPQWPESDSQHPDIAEDPQWTEPELPFGPFTTAEPTSEESTSGEANMMVFEEDSDQSDSESRAGCKPNGLCKSHGGYCVTSASQCMGKILSGACKGGSSCQCCIRGCPTHQSSRTINCFYNGGPNQCFCLFRGTSRNFTQGQDFCKTLAPQFGYPYIMAHPLDANFTQSYLIQQYGYVNFPWVNARGQSSSNNNQYWQDNGGYVPYTFFREPPSKGPTICTGLLTHYTYLTGNYAGKPYYGNSCSIRRDTLCELPLY